MPNMNILISPNAFKGTMSARESGEIIQNIIHQEFPGIITELLPIADGGDGTCELLTEILDLEKRDLWTLDPYGRPILCSYGWDTHAKIAYIDVSAASGIALLGNETKNPFVASTYGTGLLIRNALELGAREIVLGLGGSATVDLGLGILSSLGISFLDEKGRELTLFTPNFISKIRHIQKTPGLSKVKFTCLCDVKNTFFGDQGAIPVFGPQKGLKKVEFDSYVADCKSVVELLFRKNKKDFIDKDGFGAAGGIALGLSLYFDTTIKFGSTYFFEQVSLLEKVKWADLIVTGEGRYDSQSNEGKACFELMKLARDQSRKIYLITSGNEEGIKAFDQVLTLPELDFSQLGYKEKAKQNLEYLLKKEFSLVH